jgi:hypothetical protein
MSTPIGGGILCDDKQLFAAGSHQAGSLEEDIGGVATFLRAAQLGMMQKLHLWLQPSAIFK